MELPFDHRPTSSTTRLTPNTLNLTPLHWITDKVFYRLKNDSFSIKLVLNWSYLLNIIHLIQAVWSQWDSEFYSYEKIWTQPSRTSDNKRLGIHAKHWQTKALRRDLIPIVRRSLRLIFQASCCCPSRVTDSLFKSWLVVFWARTADHKTCWDKIRGVFVRCSRSAPGNTEHTRSTHIKDHSHFQLDRSVRCRVYRLFGVHRCVVNSQFNGLRNFRRTARKTVKTQRPCDEQKIHKFIKNRLARTHTLTFPERTFSGRLLRAFIGSVCGWIMKMRALACVLE